MKQILLFALIITFSALSVQAQNNSETVIVAPAADIETICRLKPITVDLGLYTPPPSDISNPLTVRGSTINVTYIDDDGNDPWPQAAKDAFNFAKAVWTTHIDSAVPIEVEAHWSNLGGCTLSQGVRLGSAGPTLLISWGGAPIASTFYPVGLANAIAGSDLLPNNSDITASFNKDCDGPGDDAWYFGIDGNVPPGKIDFVSVVLHELGHGLGFTGSAKYDDGVNDGNNNQNECNGAQGAGCFSSTPIIYDRFVTDAATGGTLLLDTGAYPSNSTTLGTALVSSVPHFASSSVEANNGNEAAPLYGPDPWQSGSSFSHLDEATYNGTPNALMTPSLNSQEAAHSPGVLTCAIFQDMGWPMGPDCEALLPVQLTNFTATLSGKEVTLSWETVQELNNAGFEVQMQSPGWAYEAIGYVAGSGTTQEAQSYQYTYLLSHAGTYRFRLKQIDFDGQFDYSPVAVATAALDASYELLPAYPNPFNPSTQFQLTLAVEQMVDIRVVDVTGKQVSQLFNGSLESDRQHTFTFDAANLPSGMYWIQVVGESFRKTQPAMLLK